MSTSSAAIHALRVRVLQLDAKHRAPILASFERALEMQGEAKDEALARISKRVLRAEAMSSGRRRYRRRPL